MAKLVRFVSSGNLILWIDPASVAYLSEILTEAPSRDAESTTAIYTLGGLDNSEDDVHIEVCEHIDEVAERLNEGRA